MTAAELLADCHARRIDLQAHGGQLDIDAPAGELTPELLARLRDAKPELLAMLASGPQDLQPQEPDLPAAVPTDDDHDAAGWTEYTCRSTKSARCHPCRPSGVDVPLPGPCPTCSSLERWQDAAGSLHCPTCRPPDPRAAEWRQRVAAARARHPVAKTWPLPGADDVLRLTPDDLPPVPWHFGGLDCYDNGRLLNELRIDLTVIGRGGVNHRSGRLRRDIERILHVARRKEPRP
jgi:hypothetical protein